MINTEFMRNNILTFGLELVSEKAILEILDHLEAVESECLEQARLNEMGASREATLLAKVEAAEKERDTLRAKIAEMKKQEPVAWMDQYGTLYDTVSHVLASDKPLYLAPGAKGEEK